MTDLTFKAIVHEEELKAILNNGRIEFTWDDHVGMYDFTKLHYHEIGKDKFLIKYWGIRDD